MKRPTIESLAHELRGTWMCIAHLCICVATLALACILGAVGALPPWGAAIAILLSLGLFIRGFWLALIA